jgi:hypothetical protein
MEAISPVTKINKNMVIKRETALGTPLFISQRITGIMLIAKSKASNITLTTGAAAFIPAAIIIK